MNALVVLADPQGGGQIEKLARTFGVDWPHLIAQLLSFCIVCAILYRFAYHPILKMLAERRRQIAQGFANAERIKAELAKTETLRVELLLKATAQAAELIEEAHAAAARVKEHETQEAIASAQQIAAHSREVAAQNYNRMLADLKSEIGRLVVQTTAAVTGKILTAEDQRRLVEETIARLAG
jgi:F-type H+-transporting ATPase subunit b